MTSILTLIFFIIGIIGNGIAIMFFIQWVSDNPPIEFKILFIILISIFTMFIIIGIYTVIREIWCN